ncbi:MAG: sodium:proton antiporter [Alphaproteobacteria bacterium]|nr:sodium:proton antiporter [Alphaproteobacteria bacterium SS10]
MMTGPALAAEAGGHGPHLDGGDLGLLWAIPFVGILLSIAICPLVAPNFWHHHFGKLSAFWAIAFLGPFAVVFGWELALYELIHTMSLEYIPFICLLGALFVVAGGVRVVGTLRGTPLVNTGMLFIGTAIASWMGTTGAAMLLIRPLIKANEWRENKAHVVVFFIFLVANIGGSLTPLGDPPLFLGFLKGVSFFWPTTHMFLPMLMVSSLLLVIFFIFDTIMVKREPNGPPEPDEPGGKLPKLRLEGKVNILLIGAIVGAVLMSGIWKPGISFEIFYTDVPLQNLARDVLLIGIALLSLVLTSKQTRKDNAFTWFPIVEVGKLFAGIFITIIPAIAMLKAGESGPLGVIVSAVSQDGQPNNIAYFWLTGILSSFLDNAPTYLVFFNTAGGDAQNLMTEQSATLLAISAGAVFMGAVTYIGNAPNFMVRAIAEERGVKMPSFFGYMVWSVIFLMPLFGLVTLVFFL